jgi:L-arabinose transport system ATP-binding protein
VKNFIQRLNIRTPSLEQAVTKLSGGNQQKVVIARWLAVHPKVLILDEPTQGIDVGAKAEIYNIINDLATQGIGIIFISSDLPELLAISDRILVMRDGSIVSEHAWTEALSEEIMSDALRQSNGSPLNSP